MPLSRIAFHIIVRVPKGGTALTPAAEAIIASVLARSLQTMGGKLVIANGVEDHQHWLVLVPPTLRPTELIATLKSQTSAALNRAGLWEVPFRWRRGYAILSAWATRLDALISYIKHQKIHHDQQRIENDLELDWIDEDEAPTAPQPAPPSHLRSPEGA